MVTRAAHQGGFFIGGSRRQPDPTHEPHWMLTHTSRCNSWHVPSAHPANAAPGRQSSNGEQPSWQNTPLRTLPKGGNVSSSVPNDDRGRKGESGRVLRKVCP